MKKVYEWVFPWNDDRPSLRGHYLVTMEGMFGDDIRTAYWDGDFFLRHGKVVNRNVIAWARGIVPYKEKTDGKRNKRDKAVHDG